MQQKVNAIRSYIHIEIDIKSFLISQKIKQMSTVTLSSIALLQERFRQLEKMKEMRQEKALLRLLSESENSYSPPPPPSNNVHCEQVSNFKSCFSAEKMMSAPKPDCQLSLSLFPDAQQIKSPSFRGARECDVPRGTISCLGDAPSVCSSTVKFDNSDSDIDTSLHL